MVSVTLIMAFVIGIFLLFGVLIKHFKCYWLISGYNTASKEKKEKIDIEGLGKLMGNFCFLLAGIFFVGTLLNSLGFVFGFLISVGSLFLIVPFVLIKAQKYDHNTQTPDGKTKKSVIFVITFLSLLLFLFIGGMIYYGVQEPSLSISSDTVTIEGMYGTSIHLKDITKISLEDDRPKVVRKTSGFDFGSILKGHFQIEGSRKVRLFVNTQKPPFICIEGKEAIILNFRDGKKTEELYARLEEGWARVNNPVK